MLHWWVLVYYGSGVLDYVCLAWMVGSLLIIPSSGGPSSRGVTQHIIPPSLTHYGLCCQCNSRPVIEVNSIDWLNSSICGRILIFKEARITMTIKNWRLQETFNTNKLTDFKSFAFSYFVHILPNLQVTQQHWWRRVKERKKEPLWSLIDLLQNRLI